MSTAHKTEDEKLLQASEAFMSWRPKRPPRDDGGGFDLRLEQAAAERHFTPAELAELWNVDPETVRNVFRNEPGVLKLSGNGKGKRTYITLRIPESIAARVHKRLSD